MDSDEAYDDHRQNQLDDAAEKITRGYLFTDFWRCTDDSIFLNYNEAVSYQYRIERGKIGQEPVEILTVNQVRRRRLKKRLQIIASNFLALFHRLHQKYL